MSTTYVPFTPTAWSPFQFRPTLDGQQYVATIVWNLFGKRWYLMLTTLQGQMLLMTALIASPDGVPGFNLVAPYFASTFVYRDSTQQFEISP